MGEGEGDGESTRVRATERGRERRESDLFILAVELPHHLTNGSREIFKGRERECANERARERERLRDTRCRATLSSVKGG